MPRGSVSNWLRSAKRGDEDAAHLLWDRYFHRVISLARLKLGNAPRRESDEEDVVISVFDACLRGAREGRFSHLDNRDDLWRLLFLITDRKVKNVKRDRVRDKRGGGRVRGESVFIDGEEDGIAQMIASDPTPETAAILTDEVERFLSRLNDETLQQIAVWKMEGYTHKEISEKLEVTPRTVDRKIKLIKAIACSEDD